MSDSQLANTVYDARIESAEGNVIRRAGEWLVAAAEMFFGGTGVDARQAEVVVRRRSDDEAVLRTEPGSFEEAEAECDDLERVLAQMTAAEFEDAYLSRRGEA
ncbi:hypothetical protein [Falsarthrobacter nasiphocae]|uniref:Uncharacterized protein n=1 Tax=Falsarthrobacter nasiphocae TaxID=189863 RepID=A0AAE3YH27_9MICC|nr:hypothetical protein [Falsarthrobacter nasiphocae]MDR6892152.1 hypothetical protein [Falsarthrobacter nasiphocae]